MEITFNKIIFVMVATFIGVVLLYTGLPSMIISQIMMFLPQCSAQEMVMPKKNDPGIVLVQKLLEQDKLRPEVLADKLETAQHQEVYYLPILGANAEDALNKLREKARDSGWSVLLVGDRQSLKSLCQNQWNQCKSLSCESMFSLGGGSGAVENSNVNSRENVQSEKKLKARKRQLEIENGNLSSRPTCEEIVQAAANCPLDEWLALRAQSDNAPHWCDDSMYIPGEGQGRHRLEVLGLSEEELVAYRQASQMSVGMMAGGSGYNLQTGEVVNYPTTLTTEQSTRPGDKGLVENHYDKSGKELLICFVPVRHSYEIPAYFNYGSYNGCPSAVVHVALAKHFYDLCKAEIVVLGPTTLEMSLPGAPSEPAVVRLVKEVPLYSTYVWQFQTLNNFRKQIGESTTWSFAW